MGSPKHAGGGRNDPRERLKDLRPDQMDAEEITEVLHELKVHQEELTAQNSQLIETQHALEESRDRYVDLYDFAPIGFMTISVSGLVREINLTGAALLGKERSRIVGLPFSAFLASADKPRFSEHLRQCRQIDLSSATVELGLNTDKPAPWVQLVTRRHGSDAVHQSSLLTAIIDITERRRLERGRKEAEDARDRLTRDQEIARARADAKDHFLATLSHELRTPLTPIVATLSDSRLLALAPEPLLGALQRVRRNLDLEVRLIDDLLDVTRISRDRLILAKERVNVHVILSEVVEMLAHEIRSRRTQVVTTFDASTEWVIGDPTRLRQVFWNLIGNAIKFSNPGGRVTVVSVSDTHDVQISVNDAGEGMDETVVAAINEHGQTPSTIPLQPASGLGLGLAICRGVVIAHGGTLRAMSRGKGHGSTFVVRIPIAAHLERWDRPIEPAGPNRNLPARPRRILIVEDHQDSADTLSQLLLLHGYEVSVARTIEEAVSIADQGFFDLVISDIRLPDGSGLDLLRRLKSNRPIRGIAVSGFGTEQDQRRSRDAGYEAHLTKPVDFNVLLSAIERVAASHA
jgi:two-component system CheB/CheR fusion protein